MTDERACLLERYRRASKEYHSLVAERGTRFREFDAAATEMFNVSAAIGDYNKTYPEQRITPAEAVQP